MCSSGGRVIAGLVAAAAPEQEKSDENHDERREGDIAGVKEVPRPPCGFPVDGFWVTRSFAGTIHDVAFRRGGSAAGGVASVQGHNGNSCQ
jgi:hypothetical protein